MWNEADRRLGVRAAAAVAGLGLAYVAVGIAGVAMRPPGLPMLAQVDPFLAILEALIALSAIALVLLAASLCSYAGPRRDANARAAFGFILTFALATCAAHFLSLSVGRQLAGAHPELARQLSFAWPSVNLALDLLAWDLLLGIALLLLAPIFRGAGLAHRVRWTAYAAGALCVIGTAAPLSGRMEFQFAAIAGYAFVLPVLCGMIAVLLVRTPAGPEG